MSDVLYRVLIGRSVIYGLTIKGESGLKHVIEMRKNELELPMALAARIGCIYFVSLLSLIRGSPKSENGVTDGMFGYASIYGNLPVFSLEGKQALIYHTIGIIRIVCTSDCQYYHLSFVAGQTCWSNLGQTIIMSKNEAAILLKLLSSRKDAVLESTTTEVELFFVGDILPMHAG
ncbi:Peroxisomal (S)-2-hydroxy-acid oxidase GLO4 [Capsicum chinense]|nr:Peroxisomal (S)-2-hydroxy-acid oxidase GLO4 [Capsicum chinense]